MIGDEDDPYGIVARLVDAVPPGSYLALSHMGADILGPEKAAELTRLNRLTMHQPLTMRSHTDVARFFTGLDLVEPGLVRVEEWRPASQIKTENRSALWGAVARKR